MSSRTRSVLGQHNRRNFAAIVRLPAMGGSTEAEEIGLERISAGAKPRHSGQPRGGEPVRDVGFQIELMVRGARAVDEESGIIRVGFDKARTELLADLI